MANPRIQDLGVIGISLLGIWLCVQAVSLFAFFLPALLAEDSQYFRWAQLFPPIIHALVGILLILRRFAIARFLFHEIEPAQADVRPPLAESLLALLGAWFVVNSVAQAAQVEVTLFIAFSHSSEAYQSGDRLSFLLSGQAWSQRAPYLIRLAVGVWLVLGTRGVVAAWLSFRQAGRDRADPAA